MSYKLNALKNIFEIDDHLIPRTQGMQDLEEQRPENLGDGNTDLCVLCLAGGSLLCCDACPAAFHMRCIGETGRHLPEGEWLCPECSLGGRGAPPACTLNGGNTEHVDV